MFTQSEIDNVISRLEDAVGDVDEVRLLPAVKDAVVVIRSQQIELQDDRKKLYTLRANIRSLAFTLRELAR